MCGGMVMICPELATQHRKLPLLSFELLLSCGTYSNVHHELNPGHGNQKEIEKATEEQ